MSNMNDRQQAYENKFKNDQEFQFRATARRNKLLGLWLAEQFGFTGEHAQNYAKEVIEADFEEPGEEDVVRKTLADIEKHKVEVSDYLLRKKMQELLAEAIQQLQKESQ